MYFSYTLAGIALVIISQHIAGLGEYWVFASVVVGGIGGAILGHVAAVAARS